MNSKWQISKEYKESSIIILQENLAALRAKVNITQEELANIIGTSRQTYYAVENMNKTMSWSTYLSLVFFFSICKESFDMMRELRIYPIDLVMQFNNQLQIKGELNYEETGD